MYAYMYLYPPQRVGLGGVGISQEGRREVGGSYGVLWLNRECNIYISCFCFIIFVPYSRLSRIDHTDLEHRSACVFFKRTDIHSLGAARTNEERVL